MAKKKLNVLRVFDVGCALIVRSGKILITQRRPGDSLGGYWEFPGGKREKNETIETCLEREVDEEVGIRIRPRRFIRKSRYVYPEKDITLYFYLCDWINGTPVRHECYDFKWITPAELLHYRFPMGDEEMIQELLRQPRSYFEIQPRDGLR